MRTPRNRDPERLRFTVSSARTVRLPGIPDAPPLLPWPLAALGGGVLAGLAGALLVTGVLMIAWLSAIAIPLQAVLGFAGGVWLLAHGGELAVGADTVTLVPLGLTLVNGWICASVGGFAYRQGLLARSGVMAPGLRRRLLLGSIGQVCAGYTAFAVVLALTVAGPAGIWRPALGAFVLSAASSAIGAALAAGLRPRAIRPDWLRRGLRGAAVGLLALIAASAVVLCVGAVLGEARIAGLETGLRFDGGGVFVWSLALLAYLPNLLGWAVAWLLGAGFTVGTGSLVSLSTTQLGMLPAIPVFGALPPVGVADSWMLAWLALGAVAAVLAGVAATKDGHTGPLGALAAGAAAGVATGVAYLGWVAASRGGLGDLRLAGAGPAGAGGADDRGADPRARRRARGDGHLVRPPSHLRVLTPGAFDRVGAMPMRLVVLVSGSGTLLQSLLDASASGELDAEVVAVGADRADAYGLVRAERAGVPTFVHPFARGDDRTAWDAGLAELVAAHRPDLVVSAGFMNWSDRPSLPASAAARSTPTRHCCRPSLACTASATRWTTESRSLARPSS